MRRAGWGRTTVLLVGTLLVGCDALFPYQARVDHRTDRARSDGPVRLDVHPSVDTTPLDAAAADLPRWDAWVVDQRPAPDIKPAPDAAKPAPDIKPVPDAVKPVPDAVKPAPDAVKPAPDAVKPAPDAVKPAPDQPPIAPPQIVITEIMVNEFGGIPEGEWFELHNSGGSVDLKGWTLKDNFASHTIGTSLVLGQNQYVVLKAKVAKVGNVYVYSDTSACGSNANICFANDKAELLQVLDPTSKVVDEVAFDPTWPFAQGHSMSLKGTSLDNSKAANWCQEMNDKYGQDYGTPGQAAGCQ